MISQAAKEYLYHEEEGISLFLGDCAEVMDLMDDNSVDSIVTDPPYGLSFMGKKWDYDVPSVEVWAEALRVLKPGGHLLAFGGSRTYHRVVVNIEDAGFEIRDQIMWLYGSGFPKSLDVSKAIDKAAGAEREVIGKRIDGRYASKGTDLTTGRFVEGSIPGGYENGIITAPATEEAKQWDGWGTALKPAHEPICVARKPFPGTVAENVLKHGTGGINIDACRIETNEACARNPSMVNDTPAGMGKGNAMGGNGHSQGRFPANLILDEEAGADLDRQNGELTSGGGNKKSNDAGMWGGKKPFDYLCNSDSGGASRFFYCAKASKADRDEGLELLEKWSTGDLQGGRKEGSAGSIMPSDGRLNPYAGAGAIRSNHHPTVKPTDLMQYLVRLVTPPGGTVLDPFMGSGSTGKGAVRERFNFIGIERDKEYLPLAKARIKAPAQVVLM